MTDSEQRAAKAFAFERLKRCTENKDHDEKIFPTTCAITVSTNRGLVTFVEIILKCRTWEEK
jgi:hypothetical protein